MTGCKGNNIRVYKTYLSFLIDYQPLSLIIIESKEVKPPTNTIDYYTT